MPRTDAPDMRELYTRLTQYEDYSPEEAEAYLAIAERMGEPIRRALSRWVQYNEIPELSRGGVRYADLRSAGFDCWRAFALLDAMEKSPEETIVSIAGGYDAMSVDRATVEALFAQHKLTLPDEPAPPSGDRP